VRFTYVKRASIIVIAVALIAGMVGCDDDPAPLQYNLSIASTEGGAVTARVGDVETVVSQGEAESISDIPAGMAVELMATPNAGYCFVNWSGEVDTIADVYAASTIITIGGNYSITGNFEETPPAQFGLTTSSTAGGSVTTPGEGVFAYDCGTVVDLVATPEAGYQFLGWTGDVATIGNDTSASTTVIMQGDYHIIASFEAIPPVQYTLTISSTEGGSVVAPGEGALVYDAGTVVDLEAVPDCGHCFLEWNGDVEDIADVYADMTTITMNGNREITGSFVSAYGDYCEITNNVLTSQGGMSYPPKPIVNYPEGHGPVQYYEGPWPELNTLSAWYLEDVKDVTPYGSGTIDLAGENLTLGPLFRDGALVITNSASTSATLTLTGTLYVTGDLLIAPTRDLTIDLNGHAIFVESASAYPPQQALYVGVKCTMRGPGVVVAMGAIYFEPNVEAGMTDPIFIISVYGVLAFKAGGDFYGALAGSIEVELQPGSSVTYPEGGFPDDLNFPGCIEGKTLCYSFS